MLTVQEQVFLSHLYEENIQLLRQLGKIPAPTRQEDARAEFCKNWMEALDLGNVYIDSQKNAVCEIGCTDDNPIVIFAAHTDVVFPDTDPLPMHEEKGRLYAPGIGDDTGNLVNLLMGMKYLKEFFPNPPWGVVIAANSCEEGLGNLDGTKALFRTYGHRVKAFISFDGFMGQCCSGAVGSHRYELTIRAKGGHSYFAFGSPSAIEQAGRLICDLYSQQLPQEMKTTINVGTIQGGSTVNSIAEKVTMLYEYRSESEVCLQKMAAQLQELLEQYAQNGIQIQSELLGLRPGSIMPDPGPLQRLTERNKAILSRHYGGELFLDAFSTDSNVPLSMGIPANTIGTIIGDGFHTRGEWLELEGQKAGMAIVAEVMKGVLPNMT